MGEVTRLLNQISGNTISDFSSIGYDGARNRTSVTASIPGATVLNGTTGYTYDTKDQLTQETTTRNSGFTDNFAYDSAGNPTTFKGVTKTYNSNNQQTGTGYTHDSNGNPTTYGGTTLTFDPENRMTAYGSVLTAGYTGDGLRAWKQNSTARTYFLYDGLLPVVEMDSSGSVTATNSFGTSGLVSRRAGSLSVFYSFDSEGNVAQRSSTAGTVLSNHLLDSYGVVRSGSFSEAFGYKAQFGYYTDLETGLQLLTHRYYDPNTGRFLTRDPISYQGGINLYSYVTNNPVTFIDPEGLAELYYWGPGGGSKFGHLALKLDDGTYISYWPSCHIPKDNVWKSCPSRPADEERDRREQGRNPEKIRIDGLDEAAIKDWWNSGKGHGDWSNYNNCSDIVADALSRGERCNSLNSNTHPRSGQSSLAGSEVAK
jgi:RHS repeat-associated protein